MRGKIIFPVFLILFLTVLLPAFPAPGEGRLTSGEYEYYVLEDSSARIVSWLGEGTEAVVPAELDGHPVSVLGYAFYRNDTLTSVTLPDTLAEIEKDAFNGCSSLTSVSFPPSLRIIGEDAFRGCSSLTELTIPDTVEMVDSGAFADCGGITRVTAPGNAEYGFFTVFRFGFHNIKTAVGPGLYAELPVREPPAGNGRGPRRKDHRERSVSVRAVIIVTVLLAAAFFIVWFGVFRIREIRVVGNREISSADIIRFSGIRKGGSILQLSEKETEKHLNAAAISAAVEYGNYNYYRIQFRYLEKELPGTVTIAVPISVFLLYLTV